MVGKCHAHQKIIIYIPSQGREITKRNLPRNKGGYIEKGEKQYKGGCIAGEEL